MSTPPFDPHTLTASGVTDSSMDSRPQLGALDPQKKGQPRTVLSCTKCRERKVKCSRTKPCDACCARGIPKECEFIIGEGNDFVPVQQSYELRKLRKAFERLKTENYRLKEENQRLKDGARLAHTDNDGEDDDDEDDQVQTESQSSKRAAGARQRRFKTSERVDNIYFGTPGLANIVAEFANLQVGKQSLTHTLPQLAQQTYTVSGAMYPFPSMWFANNTPSALVKLLPDQDEIYELLDCFQRRAQSCSFPHTPDEANKKEVDRFLADVEGNAEKHPDMLALVFATLATGMQVGQYDRSGGQWVAGSVDKARKSSDVFIACSMQALRLASFLNQPTLIGIQALVLMGPYLTNSGRFLDAWTLFGSTIRMAHAIGLHRNPKILNPVPPLRECLLRQTLWWWMLHMDQQYSVTLGRPLGISGMGDCPSPTPLTSNPTILRLGDFTDHFTILARQVLSSDGLMSISKIDEFTDKLVGLWDTMPEALQFNKSWLQAETPLPDWPLEALSAQLFAKVQCFLVLLNRQRIERTKAHSGATSPAKSYQSESSDPHQNRQSAVLRGRAVVLNSSINLLHTFLFFHYRNPAVLIAWALGQQAFSACMILILDAWETENDQNEWLVSQAYAVFTELESKGVHQLASLAVQRISDGLAQIGNRKAEREREVLTTTRRSIAAAEAHQQHHRHQQDRQRIHEQQQTQYQPPMLTLDVASMADLSSDAVMRNTGMFLLEDPGLQSYAPPSFSPLTWNMADSSANSSFISHSHPSTQTPSPHIQTPTIPVCSMGMASFPGMAPTAFISPGAPMSSPFPPNYGRRTTLADHDHTQYLGHLSPQPLENHPVVFTPINPSASYPNSGGVSPHGGMEYVPDGERRPQHQPRRQSYPQPRVIRHPGHRPTPNRNDSHGGEQQRPRDGRGIDPTTNRSAPRR